MSSLIFITNKDEVFIAADTLMTSFDGQPVAFTSKVFILPHLRMIMCGTGIGGFLGRWFIEVNDRMVVKGIENLNFHSTKALAKLWLDFKIEKSIPENNTTTVYCFGYSEETGNILSYAYRSTNNFKSEALQYGSYAKPAYKFSEADEIPTDFKRIMEEQRESQLLLPDDKRVYIGGEIQFYHMMKEGTALYTYERFDDYETTLDEIFDNFEEQK